MNKIFLSTYPGEYHYGCKAYLSRDIELDKGSTKNKTNRCIHAHMHKTHFGSECHNLPLALSRNEASRDWDAFALAFYIRMLNR